MKRKISRLPIAYYIALVFMGCLMGTCFAIFLRSGESQQSTNDTVCLTKSVYNDLMKQMSVRGAEDNIHNIPIINNRSEVVRKTITRLPDMDRDRKVISDPLYPPLNREDRSLFDVHTVVMQPKTQENDTFRLIGYLKSTSQEEKDAGGNTWKLFGRMKDRHIGDFYMSPANTTDDIKIPITSDIVVGERLRDLYTIPAQLRFNSPLLNKSSYIFIELPKGDISSTYR